MQVGAREESMLNEVEQTLARMGRLEKLVLRILDVSLRWHSIVVMNCQCLSARHVIVTCDIVTKCHLVFCVCVSKWRSYCWECGLM